MPTGDANYTIGRGLAVVATALTMLVAQAIGTKLCVKGSMRLGRDVQHDVFAKMQQFSASNMDKYSEPSLVMRLTNDVTQVQNVVLATAKIILKAPVLLILGCTTAFAMNQELSVVLIVTMPLMAVIVIFLSLRSFPKFDVMQRALDALNGKIQENLVNVREVKAFVRGDYEIERFKTSNERLRQTSTKAFTMSATITPAIVLIMNATVAIVVWLGGMMVLDNRTDIGTLQAFAAYVLEILATLQVVSLVIVDSTRAVASYRRICDVLDEEIDLTDAQDANKELSVTQGRVEFRDVAFRYFKDNPNHVLEGISFEVEPGQALGIIGSTGSGKTTVASLIPRLYDVDEGSVLVDGHDVREYTLRSLRQGIGFVPQKNLLFSGTVESNPFRYSLFMEMPTQRFRHRAHRSCTTGPTACASSTTWLGPIMRSLSWSRLTNTKRPSPHSSGKSEHVIQPHGHGSHLRD